MKRRLLTTGLALVLGMSMLTVCGSESSDGKLGAITVVSREDGSGTRDAFTS